MSDKYEEYCKGCKWYFKPQNNVMCNNKKPCKRLALAMLDEREDCYEEDKTCTTT